MPRRSRPKDAMSAAKLEQRLVLLAWLNERLGYTENRDLLADMKQADEGFDAEGHSHIYARLASRPSGLKDISLDDLARYDANIRDHLTAMNRGGSSPSPCATFSIWQPYTLKFFSTGTSTAASRCCAR